MSATRPAARPLLPVLDAAAVEKIIYDALPMSNFARFSVLDIAPGLARVRLPYEAWMVRPGGTVAGPVLMLATDTAMFAVVLAHIGDQVMAVTANININFLSRPKPAAVIAEGRILKLGRRLAMVEVLMYSEGDDTLVAHATGSYALPA
ncbi:MAG: PaaI family thioesterase [Gammaproteobacteria bacterium]|uniref:PaaI family thioesterase n=1 Tax=Nevskia sp. TaxID=1929292 RepID=UPI0040362C8C|nr:PaaI family thioesterase [Gammaproteobacteria bacterium]